jgi:hypothetical protein
MLLRRRKPPAIQVAFLFLVDAFHQWIADRQPI